ncbi:MAG: hypothetical protein ACT4PW_06010 [Acidimicrobiia bacterium]
MNYGTPRTTGGALVGGAMLARTGVNSLLWAAVAVVLIVAGLVLVRAASVRRAAVR